MRIVRAGVATLRTLLIAASVLGYFFYRERNTARTELTEATSLVGSFRAD
jgi:hypothetical protein